MKCKEANFLMEFRDLKKQYEMLKNDILNKVENVFTSAKYISGPEVDELEDSLAEYVGVKHCITCANGTDALTLALRAWGVGVNDVVFVPDFTFFSSGECPSSEGCSCIFVDVENDTYNISPQQLVKAIQKVISEGKKSPKAVITVDLFGLPANYEEIISICRKYDLLLLEDGAQGFGGEINGKKACSFGDISTTSFFPAKPLGCYGDGGAIFTNNDEWASLIRSLAVHGKDGNNKYSNILLGYNSRLDTIQAAVLQVKLRAFIDYELSDVNRVAYMYINAFTKSGIERLIKLPSVKKGYISSWAQFTIQLDEKIDRNELQCVLKGKEIPTMVYYMKPMHRQKVYEGTESAFAECPVTEQLCDRVLSLPIHPYMTEDDVDFVVREIVKYVRSV